jgi:hypothetical protein
MSIPELHYHLGEITESSYDYFNSHYVRRWRWGRWLDDGFTVGASGLGLGFVRGWCWLVMFVGDGVGVTGGLGVCCVMLVYRWRKHYVWVSGFVLVAG